MSRGNQTDYSKPGLERGQTPKVRLIYGRRPKLSMADVEWIKAGHRQYLAAKAVCREFSDEAMGHKLGVSGATVANARSERSLRLRAARDAALEARGRK